MNKKGGILFWAIVFIVLIFFGYMIGQATAAIPETINFHDKLTNSSGSALNGTYNFTFNIWDSYSGGSSLWNLDNVDITTDDNGVYTIILNVGSTSFNDQTYLGIMVGNDSEMTPRVNITSVPSALYCANLGSYAASEYPIASLRNADYITKYNGSHIIESLIKETGSSYLYEGNGDITFDFGTHDYLKFDFPAIWEFDIDNDFQLDSSGNLTSLTGYICDLNGCIGSGSGNPFNQSLNTTDGVTFASLNLTSADNPDLSLHRTDISQKWLFDITSGGHYRFRDSTYGLNPFVIERNSGNNVVYIRGTAGDNSMFFENDRIVINKRINSSDIYSNDTISADKFFIGGAFVGSSLSIDNGAITIDSNRLKSTFPNVNFSNNIYSNGTICNDVGCVGDSSNPFNQDLNTTDNVTFVNVNIKNNISQDFKGSWIPNVDVTTNHHMLNKFNATASGASTIVIGDIAGYGFYGDWRDQTGNLFYPSIVYVEGYFNDSTAEVASLKVIANSNGKGVKGMLAKATGHSATANILSFTQLIAGTATYGFNDAKDGDVAGYIGYASHTNETFGSQISAGLVGIGHTYFPYY